MLPAILHLCRVRQWLKNLMLFFPPFLSGTLFSAMDPFRALCAFSAFCLVSSASYILNDIHDCDQDRHHPDKCFRPIASGKIPVAVALFLAVALLLISIILAWQISGIFLVLMLLYLFLSVAYSMKLKHFAFVDLLCISAGFMLRLQAGGTAFNVPVSVWLFLCVLLLSLFLSAGKRLAEKQCLGSMASDHRKALVGYAGGYLIGIMYVTGGAVLVSYAIFCISKHALLLNLSIVLCGIGLLRFIYRVRSGASGDPTETLTRDVPMIIIGAAWVCMVGWGIYGQ